MHRTDRDRWLALALLLAALALAYVRAGPSVVDRADAARSTQRIEAMQRARTAPAHADCSRRRRSQPRLQTCVRSRRSAPGFLPESQRRTGHRRPGAAPGNRGQPSQPGQPQLRDQQPLADGRAAPRTLSRGWSCRCACVAARPELAAVLHALESGTPRLFVGNLNVLAQRYFFRPGTAQPGGRRRAGRQLRPVRLPAARRHVRRVQRCREAPVRVDRRRPAHLAAGRRRRLGRAGLAAGAVRHGRASRRCPTTPALVQPLPARPRQRRDGSVRWRSTPRSARGRCSPRTASPTVLRCRARARRAPAGLRFRADQRADHAQPAVGDPAAARRQQVGAGQARRVARIAAVMAADALERAARCSKVRRASARWTCACSMAPAASRRRRIAAWRPPGGPVADARPDAVDAAAPVQPRRHAAGRQAVGRRLRRRAPPGRTSAAPRRPNPPMTEQADGSDPQAHRSAPRAAAAAGQASATAGQEAIECPHDQRHACPPPYAAPSWPPPCQPAGRCASAPMPQRAARRQPGRVQRRTGVGGTTTTVAAACRPSRWSPKHQCRARRSAAAPAR